MQKSYPGSLILTLMIPSSILLISLFSKSSSAGRVGAVAAPTPSPVAKMVGTPAPAPRGAGAGASSGPPPPPPLDPNVPNARIIYTKPVPPGVDPVSYYVKILASVTGSEDAARRAMTYSLKATTSGFVCLLKGAQADQLLNNPDVLQILDVDNNERLHPGLKN